LSDQLSTTQWSQIIAARDGDDTESRQALESLCQTYWKPLYAFIRHQGVEPEEACDLTQAYFTELLEKDFLADVDAEKGRFRSFLFSSLRHFLSHERERARALKRGGGTLTLSLDLKSGERSYSVHPATLETPEDVFEYRWAMTVITQALERLEEESLTAGTGRQFKQIKPYLTSMSPQVPYKEMAEELGMSEGAVKVAVHRLRRRFAQSLRDELYQTVADPADVDDELRHMLSILRG
jgi:RNA polymerase sigma-70 factor (ECF subfamily)